jgi:hypothetical protein
MLITGVFAAGRPRAMTRHSQSSHSLTPTPRRTPASRALCIASDAYGIQATRIFRPPSSRSQFRRRHLRRRHRILQSLGQQRRCGSHAPRGHLPRRWVNLFDTADVYSKGLSEETLGKAIVGKRNRFLISTKATFRMGDGPNDLGSSRHHLIQSCEDSLRPSVVNVIIGARSEEQLRQNLAAIGWNLTREQVAKLATASDSRPV